MYANAQTLVWTVRNLSDARDGIDSGFRQMPPNTEVSASYARAEIIKGVNLLTDPDLTVLGPRLRPRPAS